MPEVIVFAALGWLLLAAASHRYRRESGVDRRRVAVLRVAGAVALAGALWRCAAVRPGERWVELLAAASLAAVGIVLLLSIAPRTVLAPVRWLAARR